MRHVPVLLDEVLESLQLKSGMNIVDCTLGDGGHSEEILKVTAPSGRLLGIDTDPESLLRAKQNLYDFQNRVLFIRDNFVNLKKIVETEKFSNINGIVIDLGWSSPQFEDRGRGFTFQKDEPLDMRLSGDSGDTASNILNDESEEELVRIFNDYGEEKLSKQIAEAIIDFRKEEKIKMTGQLVEIILQVYRKKLKTDKEVPWVGGTHPATKVFQALRIAVNKELDVLESVLPQAIDILAPGGRLAVISFHSLEDRITKHYFKKQKHKNIIKIITKKPIIAGEEELKNNVRARSAKLRVIEKI
jgi:16S rRNA (cytosine1402-N4)-methyltransferase